MRSYTAQQIDALSDDHVVHLQMVYVRGPIISGPGGGLVQYEWELRLNTSSWDIDWDGNNWKGAGTVLKIEHPEDDFSLAPNPMTVYLAGASPSMTSLALSRPMNGCPLFLYHAVMDKNTYKLIDDPVLEYSYRVSNLTLINQANAS